MLSYQLGFVQSSECRKALGRLMNELRTAGCTVRYSEVG